MRPGEYARSVTALVRLAGQGLCSFNGMEHITFDFLLGFLLAVALMVVLWVPLFFFDYSAEKRRGGEPVGSGENPPSPPLDKVHIN
ncbi:MAG TPA: hypothetical protein VGZ27_13590 [Vicinamibacterales bacterium]|jgi:hypothetical protein|nr:hypothetical protein [Vicinamibacterales bacterium]